MTDYILKPQLKTVSAIPTDIYNTTGSSETTTVPYTERNRAGNKVAKKET
jgi:hypothetical protein